MSAPARPRRRARPEALERQPGVPDGVPPLALQGRTALVTGATGGIGLATARALVRLGAHVLVVGRDARKADAAVAELRRLGRDAGGGAEPLLADLARLDEVRRLADAVRARCARLDVLLHNAGALFWERQVTPDGHERTLALNHLAPVLLTLRLRETVLAAAPARIVIVSSEAHRVVRQAGDLADLGSERRYRAFETYGRTKLMNVLFARALARRLDGTGVTANALHPGFVHSNFFGGGGVRGAVGSLAARLFGISPEEGAHTSIFVAAAPRGAAVSGAYFRRCRVVEPSPVARDDAAGERLWAASERLVGERWV